MPERSAGITSSEQILGRFARRSFLSLWSHSNVHRAPAKELCDLLVVFDDHVVIFSDKTCRFPDKPLDLAWSRWQRNTIDKSIDQLFGAERWIREQPDRLFLDTSCTRPLPFSLPRSPRVHLVCIANGATDRCRAELGGSGSLVQVSADKAASGPFIVNVVRNGRLIHLLDEFTAPIAPIVFGELNTAPGLPRIPGQETGDERAFFSENFWDYVSTEEAYIRLQHLKAGSVAFDEWLGQTANLALSGEMYSGNEDGVTGHEERLRLLAKTSRSERHALIMAALSIFGGPHPKPRESR